MYNVIIISDNEFWIVSTLSKPRKTAFNGLKNFTAKIGFKNGNTFYEVKTYHKLDKEMKKVLAQKVRNLLVSITRDVDYYLEDNMSLLGVNGFVSNYGIYYDNGIVKL